MKKTFTGSSREEAQTKANDWWLTQKGLRKVMKTEVTISKDGPSINLADRWAVTVHYEPENSN